MTHVLFMGASHSAAYAKFRPSPPPAFISKIIDYVKEKISGTLNKAVDVGCGTGQSTQVLQPHFKQVCGFDVSETQVMEAKELARDTPNVTYSVSKAESLPVADKSVQLVSVAQAIHWFDLPVFYKEVHRILVLNGVFAAHCYLLPVLAPVDPQKAEKVRAIIDEYYSVALEGYWDVKRLMIDNMYKDINFPEELFTDLVRVESFVDKRTMSLGDFHGYLTSWSAFQQLKLKDPDFADKRLNQVIESIANAIDEECQNPSQIPLPMELTYILIMGRKKS